MNKDFLMGFGAGKAGGGGGGGGLPPVTSDDNGDVLTVVDGEWTKAAPSGGGGMFIITYTREEDVPNQKMTITSTKTAQEIKDALDNGVPVAVIENGVVDAGSFWENASVNVQMCQISDPFNGMGYLYSAESFESWGETYAPGYYFHLYALKNSASMKDYEFYAATLSDYPSVEITTK